MSGVSSWAWSPKYPTNSNGLCHSGYAGKNLLGHIDGFLEEGDVEGFVGGVKIALRCEEADH